MNKLCSKWQWISSKYVLFGGLSYTNTYDLLVVFLVTYFFLLLFNQGIMVFLFAVLDTQLSAFNDAINKLHCHNITIIIIFSIVHMKKCIYERADIRLTKTNNEENYWHLLDHNILVMWMCASLLHAISFIRNSRLLMWPGAGWGRWKRYANGMQCISIFHLWIDSFVAYFG